MGECKGCKRENSADIKDHLTYCQYCKRNDNQEFHKDLFELSNNCNLTTCRYNENGKCTNEEKRKECLETVEKVIFYRKSTSEIPVWASDMLDCIDELNKRGIEIDLENIFD